MRSEFLYEGVGGEAAFAQLLTWLDDKSEYPRGSRQSFLAPFLPLATQNRFRLDGLSGRLWSAYLEWRPEHRADQHAGLKRSMSMMTFSSIIKTLVQELARQDSCALTVDEQLLGAVMRLVAVERR
jgi:hypothetical protein